MQGDEGVRCRWWDREVEVQGADRGVSWWVGKVRWRLSL